MPRLDNKEENLRSTLIARSNRILTKTATERLVKTAYLNVEPDVQGKQRAKLPPAKTVQTLEEIKQHIKEGNKRTSTPAPDMHEPIAVQNLKVTAGGTFGNFEFATSSPCWALVGLNKGSTLTAVPSSKGGYKFSSTPEYLGTNVLGPARTTHSVPVINLDPAQVHSYVIKLIPKDSSLPWVPAQGTFKTRNRHVMLKVDKVYMIDAADFGGTGEMQFRSQLGHPGFNFWIPGSSLDHAGHPQSGYMKVSSGDWVDLNFKLFGFKVGKAVEHTFGVIEEDEYTFGQLPTSGNANETDKYAGAYDKGDFEANSAHWTYNIDGGTYMSGTNKDSLLSRETYAVGFKRHVHPAAGTDLEYEIHGTIFVFYDLDLNIH